MMTQTLLTIFTPSLVVLLGILINRSDSGRLDTRMAQLETRMSNMESRIDSRLNTVENRMNSLEGRFHSDMMMVIGKLTELEVRVAKLEQDK